MYISSTFRSKATKIKFSNLQHIDTYSDNCKVGTPVSVLQQFKIDKQVLHAQGVPAAYMYLTIVQIMIKRGTPGPIFGAKSSNELVKVDTTVRPTFL